MLNFTHLSLVFQLHLILITIRVLHCFSYAKSDFEHTALVSLGLSVQAKVLYTLKATRSNHTSMQCGANCCLS